MPLYKVRIFGKVQGVAYRYSTRLRAEELGIGGMVRNEPEGTVYAEIEGDTSQLQAMLEWFRRGPPAAMVQKIEVEEGTEQAYKSFTIIR